MVQAPVVTVQQGLHPGAGMAQLADMVSGQRPSAFQRGALFQSKTPDLETEAETAPIPYPVYLKGDTPRTTAGERLHKQAIGAHFGQGSTWPHFPSHEIDPADARRIWFATFYGSMGFLMPYFNVLLTHTGYKGWQIGIISAFRPFLSAVSGPILSGLADNLSAHRQVFLTTLALSAMARASLGVIATPFAYVLFIITIMEILNGPMSALSDTAVLSSSKETGDYGSCRFWASLAYNISGILASSAMTFVGDSAVFIGYAVGSAGAFIAAWHLSFANVHTSPIPVSPHQTTLLCSSVQNSDLDPSESCTHRTSVYDEVMHSLDNSGSDSQV